MASKRKAAAAAENGLDHKHSKTPDEKKAKKQKKPAEAAAAVPPSKKKPRTNEPEQQERKQELPQPENDEKEKTASVTSPPSLLFGGSPFEFKYFQQAVTRVEEQPTKIRPRIEGGLFEATLDLLNQDNEFEDGVDSTVENLVRHWLLRAGPCIRVMEAMLKNVEGKDDVKGLQAVYENVFLAEKEKLEKAVEMQTKLNDVKALLSDLYAGEEQDKLDRIEKIMAESDDD